MAHAANARKALIVGRARARSRADRSPDGAAYVVATAGSGEEALALCAAERFDVIVLDIMLPGRDGFDVCAELKTRSPQVGIVMLSARTNSTDKVQGLRLGADDYVGKPFDAPEPLARLEAVLRRSTLPPQASFSAGVPQRATRSGRDQRATAARRLGVCR